MALLNVDKLSVHFGDESAPFRAVDRISYSVKQGEVVGIVGESGSGKSVSSLAIPTRRFARTATRRRAWCPTQALAAVPPCRGNQEQPYREWR